MNPDEIPDHLLCPICFEVPDAEVYQCLDGHIFCKRCYSRLTECPQCRRPLNKDQGIRCRHLEGLLDGLQLDCRFKSNGCDKNLPKGILRSHQNTCCYDFKKFGKFLNLCMLLGYPSCSFGVNKGNGKQTVEHFVEDHGCILSKSDHFVMELASFPKKSLKYLFGSSSSDDIHFWSPIMVDVKEKMCYLISGAVLIKKDESIGWFSIFIPYSSNDKPNRVPVQVEFTVSNEYSAFSFNLEPITLSTIKAESFEPSKLPYRLHMPTLRPLMSANGSLIVNCHIHSKIIFKKDEKAPVLETFICQNLTSTSIVSFVKKGNPSKPPPPPPTRTNTRQRRIATNEGTSLVTKMKQNLKLILCIMSIIGGTILSFYPWNEQTLNLRDFQFTRENSFNTIKHFFEERRLNQMTDRFEEFKKTIMFTTAGTTGSFEAFQYLIELGLDVNVVNHEGEGETPLYHTMLDRDRESGLKKAKLLIEHGADVNALSTKKESVLHLAAFKSTLEAVEYFIEKGADIDVESVEGITPIRLALENEDENEAWKIIELLLRLGADCEALDLNGHTLLEAAKAFKNKSFTNSLKLLYQKYRPDCLD